MFGCKQLLTVTNTFYVHGTLHLLNMYNENVRHANKTAYVNEVSAFHNVFLLH